MKTRNLRSRLQLSLCVLSALFASSSALASLPVITAGETIVFSDDFTNNNAGWTNVVTSPTSGSASIDNSVWSASSLANGTGVTSTLKLTQTLNIANGPISLYMRAKTDGPTSADDGRFSLRLSESTGNRYWGVQIRPNAATQVEYRNSAGSTAFTNLSSATFASASLFYDFKITLSLVNGAPNLYSAEVFVYDTTTSAYKSLGIVSSGIDITTGIFDQLQIYSRNNTAAAYIDSIVVTQTSLIPEPGTYALLVGGLFLGLALSRRSRKR